MIEVTRIVIRALQIFACGLASGLPGKGKIVLVGLGSFNWHLFLGHTKSTFIYPTISLYMWPVNHSFSFSGLLVMGLMTKFKALAPI